MTSDNGIDKPRPKYRSGIFDLDLSPGQKNFRMVQSPNVSKWEDRPDLPESSPSVEAERQMFEQITGQRSLQKNSSHHPVSSRPRETITPRPRSSSSSRHPPPKKKNSTTSNDTLLSSLTRRLHQVEKAHQDDQEIIRQQRLEIQSFDREQQAARDQVQHLTQANTHLKNELQEMKDFLQDYGLQWVGGGGSRSSSSKAESQVLQSKAESIAQAPELETFDFDVDLVLRRIEELNVLAGAGSLKITEVSSNVHRFSQDHTSLSLALYADGFLLCRGPFRVYAENESARAFIQDLLDGYYPHEFKDRYPEGVIFDVTDHRASRYRTSLVASAGRATTEAAAADLCQQLPSCVIRKGQIIPIRESVESCLGLSHTNSSTDRTMSKSTTGKPHQSTDDPALVFHIRSETGEHTEKLVVSRDTTVVRELYTRLNLDPKAFELRSTFPTRVYQELDVTLAEAGLHASATLFSKARWSSSTGLLNTK